MRTIARAIVSPYSKQALAVVNGNGTRRQRPQRLPANTTWRGSSWRGSAHPGQTPQRGLSARLHGAQNSADSGTVSSHAAQRAGQIRCNDSDTSGMRCMRPLSGPPRTGCVRGAGT